MLNNPRSSTSVQLQNEQAAVHQQIQDWKQWWMELKEYGIPHFGEMSLRLKKIRDILAAHFRHEEDAECFPRIKRISSADAIQIENLIQEHTTLLNELDGLVEKLADCGCDDLCWGEAGAMFEKYLERLDAHEERENQLIIDHKELLDG